MSTESRHYEIQRLFKDQWVCYERFAALDAARNERAKINERPSIRDYTYRVVAIERRVIWLETEWDTIPAERDYSACDD